MPGHKGKFRLKQLANYIPEFDITEIDGSDNLHNPEGIIAESQSRAARLFGARETLYLVNGSTSGVYAGITGVLKPGEQILIQRDSHKSAYNALMLGDLKAGYLYPEYDEGLKLNLGVRPEEVEKKLNENGDIAAVFLTYPNYYGICSDLKSIAELVHAHGAILIVDEAHGSHLKFSKKLPESATELGADIVIQSTHKTLLGFTQAAMLHICSDRVDAERIKQMARLYQSTSPSYILMSSLDYTVSYMEAKGEKKLEAHISNLDRFRSAISNLKGIHLIDEATINSRGFGFDQTKLLFRAEGLSGKELEALLRENRIEIEMSDLHYALALTSIMDDIEDLENLRVALEEISRHELKRGASSEISELELKTLTPEKKTELREAFYHPKQRVNLSEALGKLCGDMIIPYPPGVPLLLPGEKIDQEVLDYMRVLIQNWIKVLGVSDDKIDILI